MCARWVDVGYPKDIQDHSEYHPSKTEKVQSPKSLKFLLNHVIPRQCRVLGHESG